MGIFIKKKCFLFFFRVVTLSVLFTFTVSSVISPVYAQLIPASGSAIPGLPVPGAMVSPSPAFVPAFLKGIKIFPENPFRFDFLIDTGDAELPDQDILKQESGKLIKYFLTSLTIPEDDLWVNLSPYEKDRIVPNEFGATEMGRDLLSQDYLLKQLTASLIYPESDLGKEFWERVHRKARQLYGITDIPVATFNKVWIVPEKAVVYENGDIAFVLESRLKVMMEADYLALKEIRSSEFRFQTQEELKSKNSELGAEMIRDLIIPEIEKEVNEGENFAVLRQIYHSMILATWFKRNLQNSLLGKIYVRQNKIEGVDVEDKEIKEKIYKQYLEAFRKGVYDYVRDDYDPELKTMIPRKYFSGGVGLKWEVDRAMVVVSEASEKEAHPMGRIFRNSVNLAPHIEGVDDNVVLAALGASHDQAMAAPKDRKEFAQVFPELIVDERTGVITYHPARLDLTFQPDDPRKDKVDIAKVLSRIAERHLGYVPLFSLTGSFSYVLHPDGRPQAGILDDIDLNIYTRASMSPGLERKVNDEFKSELRKAGFRDAFVTTAAGTDQERRHAVNLVFSDLEKLANVDEPQVGTTMHIPTDIFFGDFSLLQNILNEIGIDRVLDVWLTNYSDTWKRIGLKPKSMSKYVPSWILKAIKHMYFLAVLRGEENRFGWILARYKSLEDRHKKSSEWLESASEIYSAYVALVKEVKGQLNAGDPHMIKQKMRERFIRIIDSKLSEAEIGDARPGEADEAMVNPVPGEVISLVQQLNSINQLEKLLKTVLLESHFGIEISNKGLAILEMLALLFGFESGAETHIMDNPGVLMNILRVSDETKRKIWELFYDSEKYVSVETMDDIEAKIYSWFNGVADPRIKMTSRIKQYGSLIQKSKMVLAKLKESELEEIPAELDEILDGLMEYKSKISSDPVAYFDDLIGFNVVIDDREMSDEQRAKALTEISDKIEEILKSQPGLAVTKVRKESRAAGFEAVNLFVLGLLSHKDFGQLPVKIQFRFYNALKHEMAMRYIYKTTGHWGYPPWISKREIGLSTSSEELREIMFDNFKRWSLDQLPQERFDILAHITIPESIPYSVFDFFGKSLNESTDQTMAGEARPSSSAHGASLGGKRSMGDERREGGVLLTTETAHILTAPDNSLPLDDHYRGLLEFYRIQNWVAGITQVTPVSTLLITFEDEQQEPQVLLMKSPIGQWQLPRRLLVGAEDIAEAGTKAVQSVLKASDVSPPELNLLNVLATGIFEFENQTKTAHEFLQHYQAPKLLEANNKLASAQWILVSRFEDLNNVVEEHREIIQALKTGNLNSLKVPESYEINESSPRSSKLAEYIENILFSENFSEVLPGDLIDLLRRKGVKALLRSSQLVDNEKLKLQFIQRFKNRIQEDQLADLEELDRIQLVAFKRGNIIPYSVAKSIVRVRQRKTGDVVGYIVTIRGEKRYVDSNKIDVLGGYTHVGEGPVDSVRREIKEEIGVDNKAVRLISMMDRTGQDSAERKRAAITVFLSEVLVDDISDLPLLSGSEQDIVTLNILDKDEIDIIFLLRNLEALDQLESLPQLSQHDEKGKWVHEYREFLIEDFVRNDKSLLREVISQYTGFHSGGYDVELLDVGVPGLVAMVMVGEEKFLFKQGKFSSVDAKTRFETAVRDYVEKQGLIRTHLMSIEAGQYTTDFHGILFNLIRLQDKEKYLLRSAGDHNHEFPGFVERLKRGERVPELEEFWDRAVDVLAEVSEDVEYRDRILGELRDGADVLELGAGPDLTQTRSILEAGHHVTMTNFSSAHIEQLERIKYREGLDLLEVRPLDYRQEFGLDGKKFDAVISHSSIGMYATKEEFIEILKRIRSTFALEKESRLIFQVMSVNHFMYGVGVELASHMFAKEYDRDPVPHIAHYWTPEELKSVLEQAGFELKTAEAYLAKRYEVDREESEMLLAVAAPVAQAIEDEAMAARQNPPDFGEVSPISFKSEIGGGKDERQSATGERRDEDPAMAAKERHPVVVTSKLTWARRNSPSADLLFSELVKEDLGVNLSEGEHLAIDVGGGAGLDSSSLSQMFRDINSDIRFVMTELPGVAPKAYVRVAGFVKEFATDILMAYKSVTAPFDVSTLQDISDVKLSVDQENRPIELLMETKDGKCLTIAVAPAMILVGRSGGIFKDEGGKSAALFKKFIEFLGGLDKLDRLLREGISEAEEISIEYDPLKKIMEDAGGEFVVTSDYFTSGLREASVITLHHVVSYLPVASKEFLFSKLSKFLRDGGIILTLDVISGEKKYIFYQKNDGALKEIGSLLKRTDGKFQFQGSPLDASYQKRVAIIDDMLKEIGLESETEIRNKILDEISVHIRPFFHVPLNAFKEAVRDLVVRVVREAGHDDGLGEHPPGSSATQARNAQDRDGTNDPAMAGEVAPLEFTGKLSDDMIVGRTVQWRYPIYQLDDGRKLVRKTKNHVYHALMARAAYVVSRFLGFNEIGIVQVNLDKKGHLGTVEEFFGETDLPMDYNIDSIPSRIPSLSYKQLVNDFGESFVKGDMYRIFSSNNGSHWNENIRISKAYPSNIRWVDVSSAFRTGLYRHMETEMVEYLQGRYTYILKYAADLLRAIIVFTDKDIEVNADEIFDEQAREIISRANTRLEGDRLLIKADFIEAAKFGRDRFREFYRWMYEEHHEELFSSFSEKGLAVVDPDIFMEPMTAERETDTDAELPDPAMAAHQNPPDFGEVSPISLLNEVGGGNGERQNTTGDVRTKGGVDFNPASLEIETKGRGVDLKLPNVVVPCADDKTQECDLSDPNVWQRMPISGFTPVIFQITPVNNLPLFLGISRAPDPEPPFDPDRDEPQGIPPLAVLSQKRSRFLSE